MFTFVFLFPLNLQHYTRCQLGKFAKQNINPKNIPAREVKSRRCGKIHSFFFKASLQAKYVPLQQNLHPCKTHMAIRSTGCPKKMWFKPIFEFMTFERVFLGVKNNSKNFGNRKNIELFSKILSKWTLFDSKYAYFPEIL